MIFLNLFTTSLLNKSKNFFKKKKKKITDPIFWIVVYIATQNLYFKYYHTQHWL